MKLRQDKLYKEKCNLLNSLRKVRENDHKTLGTVMNLWKPIKAELDQISRDYEAYLNTGQLPEAPEQRQHTIESIRLEIISLQNRRSSYKTRRDRAKGDLKKGEYQTKMNQLTAQITQLKNEEAKMKASLVIH